jgi:hypothetical protein
MATIFMMNKEIALGMVCFFHQKEHSYLIKLLRLILGGLKKYDQNFFRKTCAQHMAKLRPIWSHCLLVFLE